MKKLFVLAALFIALSPQNSYAFFGSIFNNDTEQVRELKKQTPYIVVRFNNKELKIKRQIYNAIAQAVSIKPNLTLEVMNVIPDSSAPSKTLTGNAFGQIIKLLRQIGVPRENITTHKTYDDVEFQEVRIYIR